MDAIRIFGLGTSAAYTAQVCEALSKKPTPHKEDFHDDDEPYVLSLDNVRGCDVFIITSLYSCENEGVADKVLKLLFFARSLRDASARRITLILPYLAFQRQDRKTESRAPVYTKYIPEIVEGLLRQDDRILTFDPHNLSAYQSGFRLMLDHLEARPIFCDWFYKLHNSSNWRNLIFPDLDVSNMAFASPDDGGVERIGQYIDRIQNTLKIPINTACVYKTHRGREIQAHGVMGDVKDKDVFLIDDMIASGKSLVQATMAIEKAGGRVYGVFAAHGLFVGNANENIAHLQKKGIRVITTDTIHTNKLLPEIREKIIVLSTAPLVGEAIRCIHAEESVSKLLS